MRWPIRNQILLPFTALLLAAIALTSLSAAYLAARRSERTTVEQLNRVIETLGRSRFPFTQSVLDQMRGLSGAEFVALDSGDHMVASTLAGRVELPQTVGPREGTSLESLRNQPIVEHDGQQYVAATVRVRPPARAATLLVLYPERSLQQARWDAALPPLAVGAAALVLGALISAWLADRMSRRIRRVQARVAAIAGGDFDGGEMTSRHDDEFRELASDVHRMAAQLQRMQQTICHTERTRLLGQLAGGLAHQLRNAITGARMAVQIHQRRCAADDHESLRVALRQLVLTEEQIKGLLSLGKPERRPPVPQDVSELVAEIAALVGPAGRHAGVAVRHEVVGDGSCVIGDSEAVRTAVLNLTLNALEAAGSGGDVTVTAEVGTASTTFRVSDSGPGPPAELADSLFDLFVTGKPEGVGFGLALSKQVADEHGGAISWDRAGGRTNFVLTLPRVEPESSTFHAVADQTNKTRVAAVG